MRGQASRAMHRKIIQTPGDSLVFRIWRSEDGPTDEAFPGAIDHLETDRQNECLPFIEPEEGRKHKFIIRETTQ